MVSDFAALQDGVQQFRRCVLRVGRHKPNHEFAWDIVDFLQELCKCQRLFQVFPVGLHILSQQHDLFVAVCHQLAYFPEDLFRVTAAFSATDIRHNAVCAEIVAAKHNGNGCLERMFPGWDNTLIHSVVFAGVTGKLFPLEVFQQESGKTA